VTTNTYASTNNQWARPSRPLLSSSKAKLRQFSSVQLRRSVHALTFNFSSKKQQIDVDGIQYCDVSFSTCAVLSSYSLLTPRWDLMAIDSTKLLAKSPVWFNFVQCTKLFLFFPISIVNSQRLCGFFSEWFSQRVATWQKNAVTCEGAKYLALHEKVIFLPF